ncbi:Bug family tripartite tricarboxylate transporter substrate binding protein [Ottowia thiooxydans]|uniref:Bug family tripartite tricarboxylate transporter substrate binding protein n=1 Tax=Ottowia thiooxydans TaxID=219182 RepID=UPI0003FB62F1|nr:tripartite tricarboxylate transporter substrate binding protein [Ottowia thiooxydans]
MPQTIFSTRRGSIKGAGALLLASLAPVRAFAQQAARIVVPFAAGASNDLVGRLMADALSKKMNRTFIVENKPGAGSMLGTQFVAQSKPADGQTLLLCATASMGILPAISKSVRYAVDRDFTFLVRIASSPFGLVVNKNFPANTFAEFVKAAKARPGSIRIGSAGIGALDYMGAMMLQSELGIELNVIPYKGMAPVLNDLQGGHIEACIVSPGSIRPMVQDGKVKMLAVFGGRRSDVLPQVPSSPEIGHPNLRVENWWGIAGPAGMPAATTESLRAAMVQVINDPEFIKSLQEKGFDPAPQSGDEFKKFVLTDLTRWRTLATKAKITIEE